MLDQTTLDQTTLDHTKTDRYARDWNRYSAEWDGSYGRRYQHLGDEWHDDGSSARPFEQRLFAHTVEPWLTPKTRVLEIGPGGGKWTVRLAPRVQSVTVFDVAERMLERTRARVDQEGLSNVSYVLGNGRDLSQIPSGSVDIVFSYDVFVHIALEETVSYVSEMTRVLRDGGIAIVHHAVADNARAWDRIEEHNDWYRGGRNTLGQFYYYSQDAIDRMYTRHGLRIENWFGYYCTTTVTAVKAADSMVPRLEQALRQAAMASDDASMTAAIGGIAGATEMMVDRLTSLTQQLRATPGGAKRYEVLQQIRRLIRG